MLTITTRRLRPFILPLLMLVVIVVVWETATTVTGVSPLVLPPPRAIATSAVENVGSLLNETAVTMAEAVLGFLIGSSMAYFLAILFVQSRWAEEAIMPYAIALKSTPLIALAPIIVLWAGNGFASKVAMSALVAFWPVLVAGLRGLREVDPEALDLMHSLGASRWQVLVKIRIPGSLGYLFAALRVSSSLAVVGAIIGELVGSTRGIGHLINKSSYYLETSLVFAAVAFISIAAIAFFGTIAYLEKKLIFWQERPIS